jgi:uncharacterized membrane protein YfcA
VRVWFGWATSRADILHFAGMIGIGLLAGLLIGLTGIGSGSLLTPLLLLLGVACRPRRR